MALFLKKTKIKNTIIMPLKWKIWHGNFFTLSVASVFECFINLNKGFVDIIISWEIKKWSIFKIHVYNNVALHRYPGRYKSNRYAF